MVSARAREREREFTRRSLRRVRFLIPVTEAEELEHRRAIGVEQWEARQGLLLWHRVSPPSALFLL